jgi:hypothetical protein
MPVMGLTGAIFAQLGTVAAIVVVRQVLIYKLLDVQVFTKNYIILCGLGCGVVSLSILISGTMPKLWLQFLVGVGAWMVFGGALLLLAYWKPIERDILANNWSRMKE